MKTAAIALICSAAGAGVALVVRDMMTAPVATMTPHESNSASESELLELRGQLDQLSHDLDARRRTPEPARVEVANDSAEQVGNLTTRLDALEQQLAAIVARLDAMPRGVWTQTDPVDAGSTTPQNEELKRKLDGIDTKNADALVEVADWATAQGLTVDAKRLLRLAIKADADNAAARQRLGYAKYNGVWMTAREIEQEKAAGR